MDKILKAVKKIIPRSIFRFFQPAYHFLLALTGNVVYRFPGYKMTVIGVTGTNGKSTTSDILCDILKASGEKVGMISTVSIEIAGKRVENRTNRTTLGRWKTHKLMREMVSRGCKYAVIEVASEGIAWFRVWGIPFDGAVFTNLSPEHLNYHKTMENYKNTKGKLFKKLSSPYNYKKTKRVSVVNADDKEAQYFLSFKADKKYTFGIDFRLRGNDNLVLVKDVNLKPDGAEYDIVLDDKKLHVDTKAIGEFNVYNEVAAFCVGLGYDIQPEAMVRVLEKFSGTRGRVEKVDEGQNFSVIVDYAHTPDAQEQVYSELNRFKKGRLISVFGATGSKDRGKRPDMGRVAAELTDVVIITDDETYNEDSDQIIQEIYSGVSEKLKEKVTMIPDRLTAIKKALAIAKEGDIVAITGIGHQKYRTQGGEKIAWDERQIVSDLLKNKKKEKK